MKCAECQYLKILYMPLKDDNAIWDFGRAKCEKHDLYVDFGYMGKFKKLDCVEDEQSSRKGRTDDSSHIASLGNFGRDK